ncbi:MAG: hypothetical protein CBARDCOR_4995 [uncultured Caballeronia sp.]|nr:MAG: hypothetical protein CBARDCOR_4995 [uncultured Caballeronia sp.]
MGADRRPLSDHIARAILKLVGVLPTMAQRWLGGRPIRIDGQELNPEVQLALRLLNLATVDAYDSMPLPRVRVQIARESVVFGDPIPVETIGELTIPG